MNKNLSIAVFLGAIAVIIGAFASHSLKESLPVEGLNNIETAIKYQMYHVFAVFFINLYSGFSPVLKNRLSTLFFIGILFFSGSIYAIHLASIPPKMIWFITPLGGLILIMGWMLMCFLFLKKAFKK